MGLCIFAHSEYLCPNLGYFPPVVWCFLNRLFIVTKHTVLSHSQPLSGMQSHHTQTHTLSLSLKLMSLHYNNSSLHNSKATVCLLTASPLAELLHSSYFPDPKLPHFSPRENINKHCFYYCHSRKFQDTTRTPGSSHSQCTEGGLRGSRSSAVVSQAWVAGCWRAMPQGCG